MRIFNARTLVLGGLAIAAGAAAMKNRHKVAGLIGVRSSEPEPYRAPNPAASPARAEPAPAPAVSNYDAGGPPENTATAVPAPEPLVRESGIDEVAEEAAAAAEAANIGGATPDYAGTELGEAATDEERPLAEAGEGESEGQEQTEADLVDNAEPAAGDTIEAERQIDDVIAAQDEPAAGETVEPESTRWSTYDEADGDEDLPAADPSGPSSIIPGQLTIDPEDLARKEDDTAAEPGAESAEQTSAAETPAAEKSAAVWRTDDEPAGADEQPTVESDAARPQEDTAAQADGDDDDGGGGGGSEWQTWSGKAIQP